MPSTTLASLTTLRLGGPASDVLQVADPDDWFELVRTIGDRQQDAPLTLGHGSNVIAADTGHEGTVAVMNIRGITVKRVGDDTVAATVQAGHPLADLVQWAAAEHLAGIECLAGIPGTVGAAPVQNAGAYGQQVSDALDHLAAWDWDMGRLRPLPAQACRLRHRDSRFKSDPGRWTILTATFHLTRSPAAPITYQPLADELGVQVGARPLVAEVTAAALVNRHGRGLLLDPHGPDARQAGSVFLNPPVTAGRIGKRVGSTPSRVRISHPPPSPARANEGPDRTAIGPFVVPWLPFWLQLPGPTGDRSHDRIRWAGSLADPSRSHPLGTAPLAGGCPWPRPKEPGRSSPGGHRPQGGQPQAILTPDRLLLAAQPQRTVASHVGCATSERRIPESWSTPWGRELSAPSWRTENHSVLVLGPARRVITPPLSATLP
ncbi:FAD-binding protein [Kitasatospora sp. NPDC098663]|uniref:FAD-binding protein n=1 Tax=Kitasatospora sp. NPDC098663 TaxID=3364096 RepID=UPI0038202C95